jgi:hypothetical protein
MMRWFAVVEVLGVFAGVVAFIWKLQFTFPDFAMLLLAFIIATFVLHRDKFKDLGFGSLGMVEGMRILAVPTVIAVALLVITAIPTHFAQMGRLAGLAKYFAWALLQQFALQSFFGNRLLLIMRHPNRAAWVNGAVFAAVHIPNPVLVPVTFLGGYFLTRVFYSTRNLVPLAVSHAIIGSLLSVALPVAWHHGLRVGPGYYR